jgi:hypothetical protein
MTREKKCEDERKKRQRKGLAGKSPTYRHFSISALPRLRPTNEKWLSMQKSINHYKDPMVGN